MPQRCAAVTRRNTSMVVLSLFIFVVAFVSSSEAQQQVPSNEGQCVWYGTCGSNPTTHLPSNCPYSGPPIPLSETDLSQLEAVCPEMVQDIGLDANGTVSTCCDIEQIRALTTQLAMSAGLLARCPSCLRNFRITFCYLTCSPEQQRYMTIMNSTKAHDTNKTVITDLQFRMSDSFADGVYSSCKDVILPSTNEKAISAMCGPWGTYYCNAHRWFSYMGSISNGVAPFQIDYLFDTNATDTDKEFFQHNIVPCSQSPSADSFECSCIDCEAACPAPPAPPTPGELLFHERLRIGVTTALSVITFISIVLLSICAYHKRDRTASVRETWSRTCSCCTAIGYRMSCGIQSFFVRWGTMVASHPWLVIFVSVIAALIMSSGIAWLYVTTDPVELWASPTSTSRLQKAYFDEHFQPFYRTEMLIVRPAEPKPVEQHTPDGVKLWGPAFDKDFLEAVGELQNHIERNIKGKNGTTLLDICYKPLSPVNNNCTIQSVLNYFQNDPANLDLSKVGPLGYNTTYLDHLNACFRNPVNPYDDSVGLSCMGEYGGPVFPYTAVGGFLVNGTTNLGENPAYSNATALVVTFVVNNHLNKTLNGGAVDWEEAFLAYMKNYSHPLLDVAFSAERAIQDEIERVSHGDVYTILISYVLMFGYIVLSIGQMSGCERMMVDSKVTLGLCGVLIVLLSVTAAVGFYGFIGVSATLIIIEVIPFLVLAVGVDNMFLIVRAVQRAEKLPTEDRAHQIGRVMGEVAPSLLISTGSEAACFFLGALSEMPAVRAFALYAGLALAIDFLLQITCFLAIVSLDHSRQQSNRIDVFCCIKSRTTPPGTRSEGVVSRVMNSLGKLLTKKPVKIVVLVLFGLWFLSSVPFLTEVPIGLDQELSMPEDSFLLKYFAYLGHYLSVGPPVYFVLKPGLDFNGSLDAQNKVCGSVECDKDSLIARVYAASLIANRSTIARPASSWIDDYISWSLYNIESEYDTPCCRVYENGTFCPSSVDDDCDPCDITAIDGGLRIEPDSFNTYLPFFLQDIPSMDCPKAGHAAYGNAVELLYNKSTPSVGASHFMTYHTILRTSEDYYTALAEARELAADITDALNQNMTEGQVPVEVFPYSVFYVFYEQYLTIVNETFFSMFVSVATVFIVMLVFSGFNLPCALIVAVGLVILLVNMVGLMYWFNVSLNAVSLVNMIMSVGIFVEFLSHVVFAFARVDHPDSDYRMVVALTETGTSVFSGITLTKIVGVSVLAFARSQIFSLFYFRMYVFIIVLGAAHGLLWMPVILSIVGKYIPPRGSVNTDFTRLSESFYSPSSLPQQTVQSQPLPSSPQGSLDEDSSEVTVAQGVSPNNYGSTSSNGVEAAQQLTGAVVT